MDLILVCSKEVDFWELFQIQGSASDIPAYSAWKLPVLGRIQGSVGSATLCLLYMGSRGSEELPANWGYSGEHESASHHPLSPERQRGKPQISTYLCLHCHLPRLLALLWVIVLPVGVRENLEVVGLAVGISGPCLEKRAVNLLFLNPEKGTVWLNLWIWPPRHCQCLLQQPYSKAFISTSTFSPVFHVLQIPSTKSLLLHRRSTAALPMPSYVPSGRCGLYMLLLPVKPSSFLVSIWEMLWPVEIEQILHFLHCVSCKLVVNKANSFIRCCLRKYVTHAGTNFSAVICFMWGLQ